MTKARDLANAGTALTTVSATELGYLDGVTSAVQTQIDSKIGSAAAINPTIVDAKGDIIAATAADTVARLAVGANNTVLTADSATATGLKWATPSAGALVYIDGASFSGVSSRSFDNVFTSTYENYKVIVNFTKSTTGSMRIRMRASAADNTASTYKSVASFQDANSSAAGFVKIFNGTTMDMPDLVDASVALTFMNPQSTKYTTVNSENFLFRYTSGGAYMGTFAGIFDNTNSFDGFTMFPVSGTMTGNIRIYGIVNA